MNYGERRSERTAAECDSRRHQKAMSKKKASKRKSGAAVRSTDGFCRCPDCNRPLRREGKGSDLYHCLKCPVKGSQSWSDQYLRTYWQRHKEAWMAGPRAGIETGFELIIGSLEKMAKEMGLKLRKRQNADSSDGAQKDSR